MKNNIYILLLILVFQTNYSQKNIKMTRIDSQNTDVLSLMRFQNIDSENFKFESAELLGKSYEINLKEYKKGKLIRTENLLDGQNYIKIDSSFTSLKFLSKIENDKMTVFVETPRMYSDKKGFKLQKGKGVDYVVKDFQGNKDFRNVSVNEEFSILAIITPVEIEKGYFSYCEIAQSEVEPDKYWEKFKIPHYFVVTMKFK
jgi:hypothetical protein